LQLIDGSIFGDRARPERREEQRERGEAKATREGWAGSEAGDQDAAQVGGWFEYQERSVTTAPIFRSCGSCGKSSKKSAARNKRRSRSARGGSAASSQSTLRAAQY
jgi:hypothetical protein